MSNALKRMLLVNVACMGGATFFIYLNAYLLSHDLQEYHVGLCDAGFWIISVLLQPWLGPQLDQRGRVIFLRWGLLLLIAAALGYAFVPPHVHYIFPLRVLQGAGFALYLTSAWAWISDHAPPEKMHSIFGIFGVSSLLGSIIGPVAANIIRHDQPPYDDKHVFLAAAALLGVALLVLLTLRDAPRDIVQEEGESASLWRLARRPHLRGPLVGSLSFGLAVGSLFAFAAAYLQSIGVQSVSALFVVLTLVAGGGRAFCGRLSQRFGASPLIAPCLLSLALGSAGLGGLQWLTQPPMALVLAIGGVAGVGYGLVYPLLNALAYERLSSHERGRGVSLVAACIDLGNATGAALAGVIAHKYGEGDMFLAMGLLVALTGILSKFSDRPGPS
ncbi:MAG: MFS transporter [Candidatus Eremiobacteraeota bacterium]|nr:MFS transporter [Candidatus Eremiobacteraeota bacterium]MCW5872386.1 MFS transporter [Candidatus Eremiobacteraeota bacterium]